MKDLLRSNEPVLVSFVCSLLQQAGIDYSLLDRNMSIMEGSLGVLPQRIVVAEKAYDEAVTLLRDAGVEVLSSPK